MWCARTANRRFFYSISASPYRSVCARHTRSRNVVATRDTKLLIFHNTDLRNVEVGLDKNSASPNVARKREHKLLSYEYRERLHEHRVSVFWI